MSLINVSLAAGRALVAVDTQGVDYATGQFNTVTKMLHLPHANLVVAVRGTTMFLGALFCVVASRPDTDFDSIREAMPGFFAAAYQGARTHAPPGSDLSWLDAQELVLVGWSASKMRMAAFCYSKHSPDAAVEVVEIEEPGYIMPWEDRWGEAPAADSRAGLAELARLQTKMVKQESPGTAMGGRLLIAELTQHGYSCSAHCDLQALGAVATVTFTREDMERLSRREGRADATLEAKLAVATGGRGTVSHV